MTHYVEDQMYEVERRMLREAEARLHDAELLSCTLSKASDSDAFLRVLAFEVLLKCCIRLHTGKRVGSHDYVKLWKLLPESVSHEVLDFAATRYAGFVSYARLDDYLLAFRFVFEKARYGYEIDEDKTDLEIKEKGEAWMAAGARIEDADIKYYPMELAGLIEGIINNVSSNISG